MKSTDISHSAAQIINANKAGTGTSKGSSVKRGGDLRTKGESTKK